MKWQKLNFRRDLRGALYTTRAFSSCIGLVEDLVTVHWDRSPVCVERQIFWAVVVCACMWMTEELNSNWRSKNLTVMTGTLWCSKVCGDVLVCVPPCKFLKTVFYFVK